MSLIFSREKLIEEAVKKYPTATGDHEPLNGTLTLEARREGFIEGVQQGQFFALMTILEFINDQKMSVNPKDHVSRIDGTIEVPLKEFSDYVGRVFLKAIEDAKNGIANNEEG